MSQLRRLDVELVQRKFAESRQVARNLIEQNLVMVNGIVCSKVTRQVSESDEIKLAQSSPKWVSRGALKLLSALKAFTDTQSAMHNAIVLDAGASTGGFTEVAVQWARKVYAVDVGYGQLAWSVRSNPKVVVFERMHINNLQLEDIQEPADVVIADLSFISLVSVLDAFVRLSTKGSTWLLMVKPQFEVGKEDIGKGIVVDPDLHSKSIQKVVEACQDRGWGFLGVTPSAIKGPKGNQEFFIWLKGQAPLQDRIALHEEIAKVVRVGQE